MGVTWIGSADLKHRYRVMLEHTADHHGNALMGRSCQFETTNHDDIPAIIDRVREKSILPEEEIMAFCVGLKLFSEVAMKHRDEPLFVDFWPHFGRFMKELKKTGDP